MSTAKAHIKVQVWEWIPDQVASACQVIVYDPETIMPVYCHLTSLDGYLEFDIDPGMYVIWIYGHNPMGYRPFLSDTWVPVAVLPGETKEICAALVSLIDIPVLYNAVLSWAQWEPKTFAELLEQYAAGVLKACNATAIGQREALRKEIGNLEQGGVVQAVKVVDVRSELLKRRREWAEQAILAAEEHGQAAVVEAKEAGQQVIEAMMKRVWRADKPVCCSAMGGLHLDFSTLPFPDGPLPSVFKFEDVLFTRFWEKVEKRNGALCCIGSEESPPGKWNEATTHLGFDELPCTVCKIVAEVDGHGPEARLTAYHLNGAVQTAVCPGDKRTLMLSASLEDPFKFATLSGQEAEWFWVCLE